MPGRLRQRKKTMQVDISGLEFYCVQGVTAAVTASVSGKVCVQFIGPRKGYYGHLRLSPEKAEELGQTLILGGQEQRESNAAQRQQQEKGRHE